MPHSLQVLAAVADLKNRLTPEQVIEVRQILERDHWHYTLISLTGAADVTTGWVSAGSEQAATEKLAFEPVMNEILSAANVVITIGVDTLSPLALQILQTYRDTRRAPYVHDPGQIVQDMYQLQPGYVTAVMELLRTAADRCRLVVIIENVGDALYSD